MMLDQLHTYSAQLGASAPKKEPTHQLTTGSRSPRKPFQPFAVYSSLQDLSRAIPSLCQMDDYNVDC